MELAVTQAGVLGPALSALCLCWVMTYLCPQEGHFVFSISSDAFLPIFLFLRLPLAVNVVGQRAANTLEWVDAYFLQRRLLPLNMVSSVPSGGDSTPENIGLSCPSALSIPELPE